MTFQAQLLTWTKKSTLLPVGKSCTKYMSIFIISCQLWIALEGDFYFLATLCLIYNASSKKVRSFCLALCILTQINLFV